MENEIPAFIPFPEFQKKEDVKEPSSPDFIPIPEASTPKTPGVSGYQAAVEKYRPEAAKQATEASTLETYMPRFGQVPLLGPLYTSAVTAAQAAGGGGEGATFSERQRNLYAGRQAYEEELRKRAGAGAIPAQVAEGLAVATPGGGIAKPVQAGLEKGIEKIAPYIPERVAGYLGKIAPTAGQMVESGIVGGASALAEAKPGETAEEMASRGGLGTLIGTAAPLVVKPIVTVAGKAIRGVEALYDPKSAVLRDLAARSAKEGAKPINIDLFSPEEFAARVGAGGPSKLTDVAGAKGMLEAAAARFGADDPRVKAINEQLKDRLESTTGFIGHTIDKGFSIAAGKPVVLDAAARRELSDELARVQNAPAYRAAFSNPNANFIWDDGIGNLLNTREGKQAYDWAVNEAQKRSAFNVNRGAPPIQNPFVFNNDGNIVLAPGLSGANLEFMDLVKRGFSVPRRELQRAGDTTGVFTLDQQVGAMTDFLKARVPAYGDALEGAGKYIRGNNAFDAGSELYGMMTGPRKTGELVKQLNQFSVKFNDDERQLFREGFASWLKDNPGQAAALFKGGTPQAAELKNLTRYVLGNDAFKEIDAGLRVARVSSLINAINEQPSMLQKMGITPGIGVGAGATLGAGTISQYGEQIKQAISHPAGAALTAAAGTAAGIYRVGTTRKLSALLDMASSPDPDVARKAAETLQNAAAKNSGLDRALARIESKLSTYLAQTQMGEPNLPVTGPLGFEERRAGRATGGKVGGSIGDKLVTAAEKAKNQINKATEQLLQTPDEHVAKALEIANRHI
jgi:hypothetical protein